MKYLFLTLVSIILFTDPGKIGKINRVKTEAKQAFTKGAYKTAINRYRYLTDTLQVKEDEVTLNLAHAYYLSKDTANALTQYQSLADSPKGEIRSKAQQQLGVMANQKGKLEEALEHFKQALKANPANEDARYNYELLKKKLEDQKKQQQQKDQNKDQQKKDQKDQQNKDQKDQQKKDQEKKEQEKKEQEKKEQQKKDQEQQQKDQQNKDQKDQQKKEQEKQQEKKNEEQQEKENLKKEKPEINPEKLEQMKISEEKARMILEAMKNQEKQYLQQNKRKATQPKDRGKPDW